MDDAVKIKLKAELDASSATRILDEALTKRPTRNAKQEDLRLQSINRVAAQGNRTTTTIGVGAIGNDRPVDTITEKWVSPDLQMLIKSGNKDPRFGETTYELTKILSGAPNPSLFQISGGNNPTAPPPPPPPPH